MEENLPNSLECPNCGFEVFGEVVTTLRANDQALKQLFDNELNHFICDQCAQEFHMDTPLVYKSEDLDYFIYYNPDMAETGWEKASELMSQALNESLQDLDEMERPECRLTLDRNEFIEKIALHLADLDDKLIEYLKYNIFIKESDIDARIHTLLYDFSRSDHQILEFNVIDPLNGQYLHNTQTPIELLDQLQNLLESEDCPVDLDELFSGLYVQVKRLLK